MSNEKQLQLVETVNGTALSTYHERDLVRELGERLYLMHPNATELGKGGVMAVAQIALMTGANPMPGTNGIHAWKDRDGNLKTMFGIGYWRGQGEYAGGVRWAIKPRLMTRKEMEDYGIDSEVVKRDYKTKQDRKYKVYAAICEAALWKDIQSAKQTYKQYGENPPIKEVAAEVSVIGYAITDESEYAKQGRSLTWTATERAERDLWRKLLPVIARQEDKELMVHGANSHKEAADWLGEYIHPDSPDVFEDGEFETLDDLNDGLFGVDPHQSTVSKRELEAKQRDGSFMGFLEATVDLYVDVFGGIGDVQDLLEKTVGDDYGKAERGDLIAVIDIFADCIQSDCEFGEAVKNASDYYASIGASLEPQPA